MKKIALLATVAFCSTIGLVSCNNDDDSNNNSIVGEWEWVQTSEYVNGEFILVDYTHAEGCEKDYVIFGADQSLTLVYFENTEEVSCLEYVDDESTYTVNGNTITINEVEDQYSVEYSISGDELRISNYYEDEDATYVDILKRK